MSKPPIQRAEFSTVNLLPDVKIDHKA